jgi:predicted nucleic acid-binding protein
LLEHAAAGEPVALTAPGVLEIVYGLAKATATLATGSAGLAWFTRLATSELVTTLPLDASAAVVAGRLRATRPVPPTGARRAGTKPEQRAGWVLDLQIAACAWVHGYSLATANRQDFEAIAGMLSDLYPEVPPLDVVDGPAAQDM